MKVLVDTQSFIWYFIESEKLSKNAFKIINDPKNQCFVSLASIWEMAIKLRKGGDLGLNGSLEDFIKRVEEFDFEFLPISKTNIYATQKLELHHNDPFDRLIIAQAISENLDIISSDEIFDKYPIKRLW
jgi:PIN domain nuclease of toxin-antitoxin system